MRIFPPTPLFDELLEEMGFDAFDERYIDCDGNVVEDAPQQLKNELEMLKYGELDEKLEWYLPDVRTEPEWEKGIRY